MKVGGGGKLLIHADDTVIVMYHSEVTTSKTAFTLYLPSQRNGIKQIKVHLILTKQFQEIFC
jgi:calcineurin-like phosphoesterase